MGALVSVITDQLCAIKKINQKYFEPGHNQSDLDSVHSAIESASEAAEVFLPSEWLNVVRLSRPDQPYKAVKQNRF